MHNHNVVYKKPEERRIQAENITASSIAKGQFLFGERACFACHSAEQDQDLLGPPLRGIGARLSREEILEEINSPSKIIKSSMVATRVIKKDGQVLLGRLVSSDEASVSLMLVGNAVTRVMRTEIAKIEVERKSLMYDKLLNGLSQEEIDHLLNYIISLK